MVILKEDLRIFHRICNERNLHRTKKMPTFVTCESDILSYCELQYCWRPYIVSKSPSRAYLDTKILTFD